MRQFIHYIIVLAAILASLPRLHAQSGDTLPAKDSVFPKITYEWVSYQIKISLEKEEEKLAFQCFFVNRIDSIIYLNLNRSGIELARMVLTPDSVIFVNKLEHEYYAGDYRFLSWTLGFPLDFDMMQSLMNGVDFKNFDNNLLRVEEDGKLHYVAPQRTNLQGTVTLMQSIEIGEGGVILDNDITDLKNMRDFDIEYQDYTLIDGILFFTKFEAEMEADDTSMEAVLKNIRFNVPGPTTIRIPDSFKEIDFK